LLSSYQETKQWEIDIGLSVLNRYSESSLAKAVDLLEGKGVSS